VRLTRADQGGQNLDHHEMDYNTGRERKVIQTEQQQKGRWQTQGQILELRCKFYTNLILIQKLSNHPGAALSSHRALYRAYAGGLGVAFADVFMAEPRSSDV
jgi:hypothetical protein